MSARKLVAHHPESTHACVLLALHRAVARIGITETARIVGMSASQMARRIARAHLAAWSVADLVDIEKRERDELGTHTIDDARHAAMYGAGEAIAVAAHVTAGMGLHGRIVAIEARILSDGIDERDRADVRELGEAIERSHEADRLALASLRARLGPARGRGCIR